MIPKAEVKLRTVLFEICNLELLSVDFIIHNCAIKITILRKSVRVTNTKVHILDNKKEPNILSAPRFFFDTITTSLATLENHQRDTQRHEALVLLLDDTVLRILVGLYA